MTIEVQVVLSALIRPDGVARQTEVLHCTEPDVGFEEAAARAVRQWAFRPAIRDRKPVEMRWGVTVLFLREESGRTAYWSHEGQIWDVLMDASERELGWGNLDVASELVTRGATAAESEGVPGLLLARRLNSAGHTLMFHKRAKEGQELLGWALRLLSEEDVASSEIQELERSIVENLSLLFLNEGETVKALPYLEHWVSLLARLPDPPPNEIANSHFALGALYLVDGKLEEAEPLLEKALENAPDSPQSSMRSKTLEHLIMLRIRQGSTKEAEALVDPYLEEIRRYGGETQVESRRSMLAQMFQGTGPEAGTLMAWRSKLRELEAEHGPRSPELMPVLLGLAGVEIEAGEPETSLSTLDRATVITRAKLPPGSFVLGEIRFLRGLAHIILGDTSEGEEHLRLSVQLFESAGIEENVVYARALSQLGLLRMQQADLEGASSYLRQSLEKLESTDLGAPFLITVLLHLAECESFRGHFDEAEAFNLRALSIVESSNDAPPGLLTQILLSRSMMMHALDRDEEAALIMARLRSLHSAGEDRREEN